ncbi:MAG TPA: alkaline phosphatase family protein [Candidatus Dormibacteraeota bacterium]
MKLRTVVLPALLMALLVASSCTPRQAGTPKKSTSPSASVVADPPASPTPARPSHVFVIVMENSSYESAMAQPYLASLAAQYGVATDYHPISNPSLPNYLAMTSGSTWGIRDDNYHRLPSAGLGVELTDAGISWKAYMEGFTGDCFNSPYPYALKHNPFAYYGGQCPANVVPMTQLTADLAANTPQLSWITPGMCHDGHDCSRRVADQWLAATVPQILASPAWQDNGVLFITADESDGAGDRVPFVVAAPQLHGAQLTQTYDHYSLLATIADDLQVARPGESAQANPISLNG